MAQETARGRRDEVGRAGGGIRATVLPAVTRPPRRALPAEQPSPLTVGTVPGLLRRTLATDRRLSPNPGKGRVPHGLLPRLRRPIFLIGAPRSGTTFLGDCVAALPEVSYHHEPVATKAAARLVHTGAWSPGRSRAWFHGVYLMLAVTRAQGHLRFTEKTPQNCFLVPFLAASFPDAQFVHIVRDGRDCAVSHVEKSWLAQEFAHSGRREPGGYSWGPYPRFWVEAERRGEFRETSDVHRTIWAWRAFTEAARAGLAEIAPHRHHELRYEDLVSDPAREAARLAEFLEVVDPVSQERLATACRDAHDTSVGRWRTVLGTADRAVVDREAGALLATLGYPSG